MAYIRDEYCPICEEITTFTNNNCNVCFEKSERIRIAKWNALTTEEKMQDLRKRIEKLEQGPARY